MRVVKPAQLQGQGAELGRVAALALPVDVGKGASPVELGKGRQARLDKRAVKSGVVGNHQLRAGQQLGHARLVQALATQHVVADAGELLHFCGQRRAWVFRPS